MPPTRLACCLLALVALVLTGCGDSPKQLRIGVSMPTQNEERWVRDIEAMRARAAEQGIELKVQISNNDAAKQVAQCENLLAQGIDVLILAPHDATGAAVIVAKARKAGVPVISYDRLVLKADVDVYLSFDNERVGEMQGAYLAAAVPAGRIVFLSGAPTDNNAHLFRAGALKHLQPLVDAGKVELVMDQWVKDWQPSEAMKLVENALTGAGNDIDGILAPNDGTAGGAIQALAAQGLAGKVPVTGQDAELAAARRIVAGTQSMTVFKDTRALAAEAIATAVKLHRGESISANARLDNGFKEVDCILLDPVVVDRDNIDAVLVGSGYLAAEDIHR